jgi:hypothetical protein
LSEIVERLLSQGVHRVEELQYLEVFQGLPQGVRAGIFPRGLGDFQARSRGIESSKLSKKTSEGLVPSSVERRCSKFVLQAGKFCGEILGSIRKNCQGRNGRSEFSEENSRSHESRQILQRSRDVMASFPQV